MTKKCLIYVLSLFFSCTYATNDTLMLQIFVYVFTWEHSADSPRRVRETETPSNLEKPTQSTV